MSAKKNLDSLDVGRGPRYRHSLILVSHGNDLSRFGCNESRSFARLVDTVAYLLRSTIARLTFSQANRPCQVVDNSGATSIVMDNDAFESRCVSEDQFPIRSGDAVTTHRPGPDFLLGLNDEIEGMRFRLQEGHTFGRDITADLFLPDPSLARQHCKVRRDKLQAELVSCGFGGWMLLNGRRTHRARLLVGDVIAIGRFNFRASRDQSH